jgi:TM2 domain-containing membrane protein YozV
MKTLKTTFLIALAVLFVTSCTVERRLYNKGFHVEWKKKYKTNNGEEEDKNEGLAQVKTQDVYNGYDQSTSNQDFASVNDDIAVNTVVEDKPTIEFNKPVTPVAQNHKVNLELKSQKREKSKEFKGAIIKNAKAKKSLNEEEENGTKGKSQVIALVLVILVGVLGIHRFYLGHIGIGVLMLLTGGVCGILALIDLIRIITGDLKPKDGEYTETL